MNGSYKKVNREKQLELFKHMLDQTVPYRIMVIYAHSGWGKSALISMLEDICASREVPSYTFHFRGNMYEDKEIVELIKDSLSNWLLLHGRGVSTTRTSGQKNSHPGRPWAELADFLREYPNERVCIFFDEMEEISNPETLSWLTAGLPNRIWNDSKLNSKVLLLITGDNKDRKLLPFARFDDLVYFQDYLEPFEPTHIRELFMSMGYEISPEEVEEDLSYLRTEYKPEPSPQQIHQYYKNILAKSKSAKRKVRPLSPIEDGVSQYLSRLQDLSDNISQDQALLKDYEDALRYEDSPRRRARYRQEAEQLRISMAAYQKEYDELQAKMAAKPPKQLGDVGIQLKEMNTKLNLLLAGQSAVQDDLGVLRAAVLDRFDVAEQTILGAVIERFDQSQLVTTQALIEAVEAGRIPETELQETLTAVRQVLVEIRQQEIAPSDATLASGVQHLSEVCDEPRLDVKHKLKITLPLIPLLLGYEGELELGSKMNLAVVWKRLATAVQGRL
ncbi:MAG: hypothetical protein FJZ93_07785 [Chloroflexi bacterium]|nr:hypothetical protein [Chloroflexota bacterium]